LGPRGPRRVRLSAASAEQPELTGTAGQYEPLRLIVVAGASADSRLWMELIERHHYLGYRVPVGAQLRYLVRSQRTGERVLACLQWTSAAWKMAARDRWIGWTHEQRARSLPYIVNNSRFLILPWVRIQGLASKILAHCARQLPEDWQRRYGYRPLLLETLVDGQRFAGPATGRPTGSRWAKRKGEAGWTAITKRMAPPASWCSSIPSAATSSSGSGRPSRPASLKPRPTPIGLDKAPGGGKQLPFSWGLARMTAPAEISRVTLSFR